MKRSMFIVIMAVIMLVAIMTSCARNESIETVSDEEMLRWYLIEDEHEDVSVLNFEYADMADMDNFGDRWVDYMGFDSEGFPIACGGVSMAYVERTYRAVH